MNSITTWDYAASVARVRPMVTNWRVLTVEIVDELYTAREELAARKSGKNDVTNVTWIGYLEDIGLNRMTVHRWLERYIPDERKLLTPEELEQRKQIESRARQDAATAIRKRVIEAIKTGNKPADWDDATERAYQTELKERREREARVEEAKAQMRADEEKKERDKKATEERWKVIHDDDGITSDMLREAGERLVVKEEKKRAFKQRIKLSQSGESDLFVDALMDYLDELENDNRRIEACQNIIKVCRNIAAELQVEK